ncbi:hypothetical protein TNCV_3597381 [Trichonephila clavipes]|nr:hypothetical protein TNCV_3597381 [Trichonephila clavipes]
MDESCPQNWRWLFLRDMTNCGRAKGVPKTALIALGWSIPFGRDPDHVDGTSDTTDTNSEPAPHFTMNTSGCRGSHMIKREWYLTANEEGKQSFLNFLLRGAAGLSEFERGQVAMALRLEKSISETA